MKKYFFNLILLLLLASTAIAQDVRAFTLQEAIDYGFKNSNSMKNHQIAVADAELQIKETTAIGLPKVNGKINWQHFIQLPVSLVPAEFFDPMAPAGTFAELEFGTKNNITAGLEMSALLLDGSYLYGLRAARMYRDFINIQKNQKVKDIRDAVREAYLPALIIEENKQTLIKNITNLDRILNETKALYKEGFVEQLDIDRLELSLANLNTELSNLDYQLDLVYHVLKFQMGYPITGKIKATDNINALLVKATDKELTDKVDYNTRPEYTVVKKALELNELRIQVNKMGYYPNIAAFGSYQLSAQGNNLFKNTNWIPTAVVGLQVNVPIFDGFERKAKIQRDMLKLEQTKLQQIDLERAIDLEVQTARTQYLSAKQRLESQQKNIDLAEKIYKITQIKYREGVGSTIEITQAEQELYQTQANYTNALYELLKAKIALDKAYGK